MENVISVIVTKEDLKNNYHDNRGCPLFQTLKRKGYPIIHVSGHEAYFGPENCPVEDEIPFAILEHLELVDACENKEPLRVHLLKI